MVASNTAQETDNCEYVHGSLSLRGTEFPFYLKRQNLDLGSAGRIQFFYMPSNLLRGNDPERDVSNFRSCIGHWYAAMRKIGAAGEWDQQRHFVMASSHALFNRDKGPQSIYRDAYLREGAVNIKNVSLPDDIRIRIRNAVLDRDRDAVKQELDDALEAPEFDRGDLLGFQRAFGNLVDKGVNSLRLQGEDGVAEWLKEVDYWIKKFRKKSAPRVRRSINFFEYQAKASFYLCYANFWSSLIPWLQEHHALDEPSKRFLSFWHNQNQPIEIPHGQTRSGIIYPTRGGIDPLPDVDRGVAQSRYEWNTEHIGPRHVPDVFAGQVLALHPLSWMLLSDPALREAVGKCIVSPFFTRLLQDESVELFSEYWGMIDAILTAAHLYRRARNDYENRRGVRETGGDATIQLSSDEDGVVVDENPISTDTLLGDYVLALEQVCDCAGRFNFRGILFGPPEEHRQDTRELLLQCASCSSQKQLNVTEQQVWSFLHE